MGAGRVLVKQGCPSPTHALCAVSQEGAKHPPKPKAMHRVHRYLNPIA